MGIKANSKKLASKLKKNNNSRNSGKTGIRKAAANNPMVKKPMSGNMQQSEVPTSNGQIPPEMLAKLKGGR